MSESRPPELMTAAEARTASAAVRDSLENLRAIVARLYEIIEEQDAELADARRRHRRIVEAAHRRRGKMGLEIDRLRAKLAEEKARFVRACGQIGELLGKTKRFEAELTIATKLYARARKISIDDAAENIRDARLIHKEEEPPPCPSEPSPSA